MDREKSFVIRLLARWKSAAKGCIFPEQASFCRGPWPCLNAGTIRGSTAFFLYFGALFPPNFCWLICGDCGTGRPLEYEWTKLPAKNANFCSWSLAGNIAKNCVQNRCMPHARNVDKLLLSWWHMVLQQERKAIFQTYYAESSALERTLKTTLKAHCWIHTRTLRRIWRKALCELFVKAVSLVSLRCVCVRSVPQCERVCRGAAWRECLHCWPCQCRFTDSISNVKSWPLWGESWLWQTWFRLLRRKPNRQAFARATSDPRW